MNKKYKNIPDEHLDTMLEGALEIVKAIQDEKNSRTKLKKEELWNDLIRAVKAYAEVGRIEVCDEDGHILGIMTKISFYETPGLICLH